MAVAAALDEHQVGAGADFLKLVNGHRSDWQNHNYQRANYKQKPFHLDHRSKQRQVFVLT
jgi:hypothetical protein